QTVDASGKIEVQVTDGSAKILTGAGDRDSHVDARIGIAALERRFNARVARVGALDVRVVVATIQSDVDRAARQPDRPAGGGQLAVGSVGNRIRTIEARVGHGR